MHSPESLLKVILGFGEPDAMHLTSTVSPTVVITLLGSSIHFGDASKIYKKKDLQKISSKKNKLSIHLYIKKQNALEIKFFTEF